EKDDIDTARSGGPAGRDRGAAVPRPGPYGREPALGRTTGSALPFMWYTDEGREKTQGSPASEVTSPRPSPARSTSSTETRGRRPPTSRSPPAAARIPRAR